MQIITGELPNPGPQVHIVHARLQGQHQHIQDHRAVRLREHIQEVQPEVQVRELPAVRALLLILGQAQVLTTGQVIQEPPRVPLQDPIQELPIRDQVPAVEAIHVQAVPVQEEVTLHPAEAIQLQAVQEVAEVIPVVPVVRIVQEEAHVPVQAAEEDKKIKNLEKQIF